MRLLQTADWHLGKKIYKQGMIEEHKAFLDWLLNIIIEKDVDVLLIPGDIFDSHTPSIDAYELYYRFLSGIKDAHVHAVIITGNHDPSIRLNAPRDFLEMANIHIIGGTRKSFQEYIVNLDINGERISFAAIPFLNEDDVLHHISFENDIDRQLRYREAVRILYKDCISTMPPDSIRILMGHFFINGSSLGNTERLIRIENIQPVLVEDLLIGANYVAMGHVHRPQRVNVNDCPIVYSGSPIPLSFEEAEYDKKVFLIDIDKSGKCDINYEKVPIFRELIRVEGTLDEILGYAKSEDWKDKYIEVTIKLNEPKIGMADNIRKAFLDRGGKAFVKFKFPNLNKNNHISVDDIKFKSPIDIFCDFYRNKFGEDSSDKELDELIVTFSELLDISKTEGDYNEHEMLDISKMRSNNNLSKDDDGELEILDISKMLP